VQGIKRPALVGASVVVAGVLATAGVATAAPKVHAAALTASSGGTLKVLTGSYPDSLDPQFGYTTQSSEADTAVYTPLITYAQKPGEGATQLIPGLATALPKVSANGLTYTMTLRQGLTFSDGTPVVASDLTYAIERAIKLSWGGSSFYTGYIAGAMAYGAGTATTISGIVTDDATGAITITLTSPYGAFDNILAFPSSSPVPPTTPMTVESTTPPLGVGPYTFGKVVPNVSYTLVRNPTFATFHIPGLATGSVAQVVDTVDSNNVTEAQQVISNQADIFDPGDTLPSSELAAAKALPKSRYSTAAAAETNYIFLNSKTAPFNNLAARQAVDMALDRTSLTRLAAGFSNPACYFLPPNFPGHVSGNCEYGGNPAVSPSAATVAKAKAMIKKAGLAGSKVTVWSQTKEPRQSYMVYYTGLLNQLGFKATLKTISDSVYFQEIGAATNNPQTGFADWSQDFPDPSDFYLLLSKAGIQSTNNENFGNVDDPHIEAQLKVLDAVPSTKLASVDSKWEALEKYVNSKAYIVPFGNETLPLLFSNRVKSATFSSVNYITFATVKLS
jgi:peptide/nickel transport system substrate-binding protein